MECGDLSSLLDALLEHGGHDFEADWAAVVNPTTPVPLATVGCPPPAAWLGAFVTGSRSAVRVTSAERGPDDVAWTVMAMADLVFVLGRHGRPFRVRERRQLTAVGRIADRRWVELELQASRQAHPSCVG